MSATANNLNETNKDERVFSYRPWWGLAASVLVMGIIMMLAPFADFELQPRASAFDYPWKLPDPTLWTRSLVWTLYGLHQIGIWYLINKAQAMQLSYTKGLHWVNVQAFALNGLFVALHIAQTKWTYDALAQDVHEISALASVAIMLFVIMVMENDRRGLVFGKRVPFPKGVGEYARKYHGYYFSWAITYTFWYHPIETTPGHLLGLFYMFMLFMQGSMFMTRYHVNRWWTLTLEFMMVVHGTTVAWFAVAELSPRWAQFLFGGLAVFLITQMHGVPFKRWHKGLFVVLSLGGGSWYYALHMDQLARIPGSVGVRYGMTLACVLVIWLIMRPFIWRAKVRQQRLSE